MDVHTSPHKLQGGRKYFAKGRAPCTDYCVVGLYRGICFMGATILCVQCETSMVMCCWRMSPAAQMRRRRMRMLRSVQAPPPCPLKILSFQLSFFHSPALTLDIFAHSSPPVADSSGGEGFPPHSVSHPQQRPENL